MTPLYIINLLLYALLIVAGLGGFWIISADELSATFKLVMSIIVYSPLLITGLGFLLRDARLLTWLSFILLFYFCGFVTQFVEPDLRLLASVRIALVSLLFCTTLFYIRHLNTIRRTP